MDLNCPFLARNPILYLLWETYGEEILLQVYTARWSGVWVQNLNLVRTRSSHPCLMDCVYQPPNPMGRGQTWCRRYRGSLLRWRRYSIISSFLHLLDSLSNSSMSVCDKARGIGESRFILSPKMENLEFSIFPGIIPWVLPLPNPSPPRIHQFIP